MYHLVISVFLRLYWPWPDRRHLRSNQWYPTSPFDPNNFCLKPFFLKMLIFPDILQSQVKKLCVCVCVCVYIYIYNCTLNNIHIIKIHLISIIIKIHLYILFEEINRNKFRSFLRDSFIYSSQFHWFSISNDFLQSYYFRYCHDP